jgi:hypothetical protein
MQARATTSVVRRRVIRFISGRLTMYLSAERAFDEVMTIAWPELPST